MMLKLVFEIFEIYSVIFLGEAFNYVTYEELRENTYPHTSKAVYLKEWDRYLDWVNTSLRTMREVPDPYIPNIDHFGTYFNYLYEVRKMKVSTLWTIYSRLNAVYLRTTGESLNKYPAIAGFIKNLPMQPKKKAKIFKPSEVADFLNDESLQSKYWLVRKAVATIMFFGGLRVKEATYLEWSDITRDKNGWFVTVARAKARNQKQTDSVISIPVAKKNWRYRVKNRAIRKPIDGCRILDEYVRSVCEDLKCEFEELSGRLFRATKGKKAVRFTKNGVLGKNTISKIGVEVNEC